MNYFIKRRPGETPDKWILRKTNNDTEKHIYMQSGFFWVNKEAYVDAFQQKKAIQETAWK